MNDRTTTLTERGQTSIPASIRRQIGMRPGQCLRWELLSDRELRVRVESAVSPAGAYSALGYARRWLPTGGQVATDEILKQLREGEDD